MPPQSRGHAGHRSADRHDANVVGNVDADVDLDSPARRDHGGTKPTFQSLASLPAQLRPYFDDYTRPRSSSPDQTTPTALGVESNEDDTPTSVRPRSARDQRTENVQGDADYDSLDDKEFESHYSRRESSASSSEDDDRDEAFSERERKESDDEDGTDAASVDNGYGREYVAQRVSSLPSSVSGSNHTSMLHLSHSTTSLTRAVPPLPPPLYPPFYNRPPTPLPPSPSLTSLLRPPSLLNRSATSTRPTTPDSSDFETPATNDDTEAAVASSARRAQPLPPTHPKVPTYEYYGFVLYLASTLAFFLYILWAYLPSPFLHALGITYYPNRWWAIAVPSWIVMALVYTYVALACWNIEHLTLGLERIETMVDDASNVAILDDHGWVRTGGSKKMEAEHEERQKRDRSAENGSWGRKKGKKERRRRERIKEGLADGSMSKGGRYGYMGEVVQGRLVNGSTWSQVWNEGTDAVMDIPISGVCEVLYGEDAEYSS